ncbi:MAG TPA: caspase family protein [Longimicrobium sp.]|nr:caspase family protein [Longimicrobium sp.]
MPLGLSLHIGLNEVDKEHYGSPCKLTGCVGDAHAMRDLAQAAGFEPTLMLGAHATAEAVLGAIGHAAQRIGSDGILLLTYSGHGGRVRDVNDDEGGRHSWDETWCTHDRQVVDDELFHAWADFPKGARVLVVSDSCFSGHVIRAARAARAAQGTTEPRTGLAFQPLVAEEDEGAPEVKADAAGRGRGLVARARPPVMRGSGTRPRPRALSSKDARRIYLRKRSIYDRIQKELRARPSRPVEAEVLLLSAAQDNETAQDGDENGAFTRALLDVWNKGEFRGNYRDFYSRIRERLKGIQHPHIMALRPPSFSDERPFTI